MPRLLIFCRSSSISCCTSSRCVLLFVGWARAPARPGRCRSPRGAGRPARCARGGLRWRPGPAAWIFSSSLRTLPRAFWISAVRSARCCWSASRWLTSSTVSRGERLLAEVELGDFRFRPQDVPPRGLGALAGTRPVARGLRRWPGARSCWLSSNCRSRACRLRSRSSLLASSTLISVVSRLRGLPLGLPARRSARPRPARSASISASAASSCLRCWRASARRPQRRLVLLVGGRVQFAPPASPAAGRTGSGALRRP